jgi:hypothetical protein
MADGTGTQWDTIAPLLGATPGWASNTPDALRMAAYEWCDQIYWNSPKTWLKLWRGSENNPIYLPSGKVLVNAINRFLGVQFDFAVTSATPNDPAILTTRAAFTKLFRRERFFAQFIEQKRNVLKRGDAFWQVYADAAKPTGTQVNIKALDPATVFPIYDATDDTRLLGYYIAQLITDPDDDAKEYVERIAYRKVLNSDGTVAYASDGTVQITYEKVWCETDKWDDRPESDQTQISVVKTVEPLFTIPGCTSLPVYHLRNGDTTARFGSSEFRGVEGVLAAISRTVTDEDLALALEGLGLYVTNSGPPKGADGVTTVPWQLGPGRVVELTGGGEDDADKVFFERVQGISSVEPFETFKGSLADDVAQASGVPGVALGNVDVALAESGIALALKMMPLLAGNREREVELLSNIDNLFYDLATFWLPTYDGMPAAPTVDVTPVFGDAMPIDRAAVIAEVTALLATVPPLITPEQARAILTDKLGYEFDSSTGADVLKGISDFAKANDPFGEALNDNLTDDPTA